jgi:hypothetical protein
LIHTYLEIKVFKMLTLKATAYIGYGSSKKLI